MDLSALVSILVNIVAPIVMVALLGMIFGRVFHVDARPLSRLSLYIFSPALVFLSAYRTHLGGDFVAVVAFAFLITLLMGIVTGALILVMRYDRLTASAFALSVLFVNAGNYGLPLILFAYGEEALALAAAFFTVTVILTQTLAVFIASRGSASAGVALLNVFKLPLIYAVVLGLVFNFAGLVLPDPMIRSFELLSDAAIPVMLVILGIELARTTLNQDQLHVGLATCIKLAVAPVVAVGLAALMGLQGVPRAVCVIESSMPTAVMASIVAVEFNSRPEFVMGVIFLSTVGSVFTLTVLLWLLP